MKTYLAILLSFITLLHASAMAQEKVDNKIRLDSVKDVDNPFAKLDGTKATVIDPATIVRNLQALENKQEEEQTQQEALVNAAELTDLQAVINALKQPAQKVEYIAKEKLPLVSRPLSQYELRGVMVSFADDPSLLSQYDKFNIEDMVSSPEVVHVVQGFETLESIARLYDTSELAIEAANGLLPNESLLNGTPLIVPLSLPMPAPSPLPNTICRLPHSRLKATTKSLLINLSSNMQIFCKVIAFKSSILKLRGVVTTR